MKGINSRVEIIEAVNACVDLDRVLGIHAFSLEKVLEDEPDFLKVRAMPIEYMPVHTCLRQASQGTKAFRLRGVLPRPCPCVPSPRHAA